MTGQEVEQLAQALTAWLQRAHPEERQLVQDLRRVAAGAGAGVAVEMVLDAALETGDSLPADLLDTVGRFAEYCEDPELINTHLELMRLALAA